MTKTTFESTSIMTIAEIAEYLTLHPLTVRKMANEGTLPVFKVGRQWRASRAILDRWIEKQSLLNLSNETE